MRTFARFILLAIFQLLHSKHPVFASSVDHRLAIDDHFHSRKHVTYNSRYATRPATAPVIVHGSTVLAAPAVTTALLAAPLRLPVTVPEAPARPDWKNVVLAMLLSGCSDATDSVLPPPSGLSDVIASVAVAAALAASLASSVAEAALPPAPAPLRGRRDPVAAAEPGRGWRAPPTAPAPAVAVATPSAPLRGVSAAVALLNSAEVASVCDESSDVKTPDSSTDSTREEAAIVCKPWSDAVVGTADALRPLPSALDAEAASVAALARPPRTELPVTDAVALAVAAFVMVKKPCGAAEPTATAFCYNLVGSFLSKTDWELTVADVWTTADIELAPAAEDNVTDNDCPIASVLARAVLDRGSSGCRLST